MSWAVGTRPRVDARYYSSQRDLLVTVAAVWSGGVVCDGPMTFTVTEFCEFTQVESAQRRAV